MGRRLTATETIKIAAVANERKREILAAASWKDVIDMICVTAGLQDLSLANVRTVLEAAGVCPKFKSCRKTLECRIQKIEERLSVLEGCVAG